MSLIARFIIITLISFSFALPATAQEDHLTISVAFGPNATVPDPRVGYNGWLSNQMGVTETLMGIDYELNLYPRLAKAITQVSPTTWQVTLRDGIQFHDGTPMTATAVVASTSVISDDSHPAHNKRVMKLLDLANITATSDSVVVFETNKPNAAFPAILSEPGITILGEASEAFPINGTGPFVFNEAIPQQLYSVTAHTNYWQGSPKLKSASAVVSGDPATAALAFEAGEVDMVINYPETDYKRIQQTGAQGFSASTARLFFYTVNAASGPMANPLIRQAVSAAIDRQGVVDAALSGVAGAPAGTLYPAGTAWAADITANYDPTKAEALLKQAGAVKQNGRWFVDGEPLTIDIVTYSSRAALPPTAELTQAFLSAIGIKANVKVGEWGASNDAIAEGTADMFLQAWITVPQGDPASVLETLLKSDGGSNAGQYSNSALDQLLEQARTAYTQTERKSIFDQVQSIIAADAALIPIFHANQINVAKSGLTGYAVHPSETYWLDHKTQLTE